MQVVFYVDRLFCLLFILHLFCLLLVRETFGLYARIWKMLLADLSGSLVLVILLSQALTELSRQTENGFPILLTVQILGTCLVPQILMLCIAFGKQSFQTYVITFACFTGYEILLGGSTCAISKILFINGRTTSTVVIFLSGISFTLIYFYTKYRHGKRECTDRMYRVRLNVYGMKLKLNGFADSGNHLLEPYGKRPVVILEEKEIQKFIDLIPMEKQFLVPFHSVGKKSGLMKAVEVPDMWIRKGNRELHFEKVVVAFSKEELSTKHAYQMILHPKFITYWEE